MSEKAQWWLPAQTAWELFKAVNGAVFRAIAALCLFFQTFPALTLVLIVLWILWTLGVW